MGNGTRHTDLVLRTYKVAFNCDLTSSSPKLIPLGVMTSIEFGDRYSLGVMARRALNKEEAAELGTLSRKAVAKPYNLLKAEQERVMAATDRAEAFMALEGTPSSVTYTLMAEQGVAAPSWVANKPASAEVQQYFKDELLSAMRHHYWAVVGREDEDSSVVHSHNVLSEMALA
jgi:hypothetical protein